MFPLPSLYCQCLVVGNWISNQCTVRLPHAGDHQTSGGLWLGGTFNSSLIVGLQRPLRLRVSAHQDPYICYADPLSLEGSYLSKSHGRRLAQARPLSESFEQNKYYKPNKSMLDAPGTNLFFILFSPTD